MNLRNILLVTTVSLMVLASAASAQETLGDLVQQTGCDWMAGKWVGQSDEGEKYQIEYKWEIERHVMSVHFKGFDYEYHGIIYYKAEDEEVIQVGVDNKGGYGKGVWEATARFRSEHRDEYGEISRTGFIYSKSNNDTMKAAVYRMDQYGAFDQEPRYTLEFKRQKEAPKKVETKVSTIELKGGTGTVALTKLDVEVESKAEKSTGK